MLLSCEKRTEAATALIFAPAFSRWDIFRGRKKTIADTATLHAYDATKVSNEIWNSNMNAERDALGGGIALGVPVVADGRVIVIFDTRVGIYGLLQ